jgi:hypothetical protein
MTTCELFFNISIEINKADCGWSSLVLKSAPFWSIVPTAVIFRDIERDIGTRDGHPFTLSDVAYSVLGLLGVAGISRHESPI